MRDTGDERDMQPSDKTQTFENEKRGLGRRNFLPLAGLGGAIPLLDTTVLHCRMGADFILGRS
jgi:hypothetical protein